MYIYIYIMATCAGISCDPQIKPTTCFLAQMRKPPLRCGTCDSVTKMCNPISNDDTRRVAAATRQQENDGGGGGGQRSTTTAVPAMLQAMRKDGKEKQEVRMARRLSDDFFEKTFLPYLRYALGFNIPKYTRKDPAGPQKAKGWIIRLDGQSPAPAPIKMGATYVSEVMRTFQLDDDVDNVGEVHIHFWKRGIASLSNFTIKVVLHTNLGGSSQCLNVRINHVGYRTIKNSLNNKVRWDESRLASESLLNLYNYLNYNLNGSLRSRKKSFFTDYTLQAKAFAAGQAAVAAVAAAKGPAAVYAEGKKVFNTMPPHQQIKDAKKRYPVPKGGFRGGRKTRRNRANRKRKTRRRRKRKTRRRNKRKTRRRIQDEKRRTYTTHTA